MQLSETRFVKIDGTNISASVNSATEAKIAIKEIRQKKKEFAHIKRGLLRQKKDAERQAGKGRSRNGAKTGFFHSIRTTVSRMASVAGAYGTASAKMDLPRIEQECAKTDEILHNLDSVMIQIEGKLLRFS